MQSHPSIRSLLDSLGFALLLPGLLSFASTREQVSVPSGVPTGAGAFVRVDIKALNPPHPSWAIPVHAYFQRSGAGWKLVGFERLPDRARP